MIDRPSPLAAVRTGLRRNPVVALIGPRQCGKTTLARQLVPPESPNYFDLENPASIGRLDEPMTALGRLRGVIVIDEVQRRPDLFPVLRVLADRKPLPSRFLILGSASPELLRQSSESLAGRIETIALAGFALSELSGKMMAKHWRRGGFPRSFLARSEGDSEAWRRQFVQTFIERDLPQLGVTMSPTAFLRFWTMLAHYHGQTWNASEPARSLAVTEPTVRRYLDLLTGLFLVRQLPPWHENLAKRQVKSPKVYLRDTGLLHSLLGIRTERELLSHPKCGASWEGYALEELLKTAPNDGAYFWATHQGAELDLLLIRGGKKYGVEIKRQDAPVMTPSMRIALQDLSLDHLTVLYPGDKRYEITDHVTAIPLSELAAGNPDVVIPGRRGRGRDRP
jgi:uncharacterized protein